MRSRDYKHRHPIHPIPVLGVFLTFNNTDNVLDDQSKLEEALATYEKVLALQPYYAEVHRNLSSLIKYQTEDTQVALVVEMILSSYLTDDTIFHLLYTYAEMTKDLGDLDTAYENYVAGGKLQRKLPVYKFKYDECIFDQIKKALSQIKDLALSAAIKTTINTLIFILRKSCSGTTLVE